MKMFKKMNFDKYRMIIKIYNAKFESIHVTSLQKNKQNNKNFLIMMFRTKKINKIIQNDVIIAKRIHIIKIYNRKCRIKQCFNCYKYKHFSFRYINKQCCNKCDYAHVTFIKKNFHNECKKKNSIDVLHATKRI